MRKNDPYLTASNDEPDVVTVNWNALSEVVDIPVDELKRLHREGDTCDECGEFLETVGAMIKHDCSEESEGDTQSDK